MTEYQKLTDDDLIALLYTEGDRLSRAAVEEFVLRGERMVKPLVEIVSNEKSWYRMIPEGWAIYHAVSAITEDQIGMLKTGLLYHL